MDLSQNQNLIVWLRCQLCRGSFSTVTDFIEHKQQWHLIEFNKLNSNCIIFEEVTVNQNQPADETPATKTVKNSDANLRSQIEIQAGPEPEKEVVPCHDTASSPTLTVALYTPKNVDNHENENDDGRPPFESNSALKQVRYSNQGQQDFAHVNSPFVLITRLTLKKIQATSQKTRPSSKKPKSVRSSIRRKKKKTPTAKSKSFQCLKAGCSKTFRKLLSRNIHFATHGKSASDGRQQDRPFHCEHPGCGKSFKRMDVLRSHLETHTDPCDRRTFPCQICSKRFFKKACLDTHYREVHGNARPFPCPHSGCTKSFKRKEVAWNHFRTHAAPNDRPLFACKICKLPYLHLKNLRTHCLVVHGAEASTGQT